MKKHLYTAFALAALCGLIVPAEVLASHNERRESSYSREVSRLPGQAVEEFAIPVLFGLALTDITPDFGDPRGGGTRSHEGQDFMAVLGTPIVSPTVAVVTRMGTGESAGKYVYTANPGGETFRYMHLDDFGPIETGDVLRVGDYIGTVGDSGNAMGGAAHLHFEVRKGNALDPYPRLQKEFSLKEKMGFVTRLFNEIDEEEKMAKFLVETYPQEFAEALTLNYTLPREIKTALKNAGVEDIGPLVRQLEAVINSIPGVVRRDLAPRDQGAEVSLMQVFLIHKQVGPAAEALARSGATGYFGAVTEAALREYQDSADTPVTGVYDGKTRSAMLAK